MSQKISKQEVIGRLKTTGSVDKDVLYAAKMEILKEPLGQKKLGGILMVFGGAMVITILGAIAGIPFFFVGWWTRKRAVSNINIVEEAYSQYIAGL